MRDFQGKVAVVTGAASGIGLASAKAFAREGMDVALLDVRAEAVEAAAEQVRAPGRRAIGIEADVADDASVKAAAQRIDREFGKVHLLMNNAAVFLRGPDIATMGDDVWDWLLGVNLYGPIHCIRAFLPRIQAHGQGGWIVNTASISGFVTGDRKNGGYGTSKFALVALSEALALDLRGSGVGVSVILPAAVSTEFYEHSAELRGDLGGPNLFPAASPDTLAGMTPDEVAARMIDGVKAGRFFIATHPSSRAAIEARHAELMAAYDAAEAWTDI